MPRSETKNSPTPNNSIEKPPKVRALDQWCETNESDANTIPDFEPTPNNHLYDGLKVLYSEAKAELACKDLESQTLTQDFKNVRSQFGSALTVIEDLNAKNQSLSDRVGSIESNLE